MLSNPPPFFYPRLRHGISNQILEMQVSVRPRRIHFLVVQIRDQSLGKEGVMLNTVDAPKCGGIVQSDIAAVEDVEAQPAHLA